VETPALKEAVQGLPSGLFYYHLAVAHLKARDRSAAAEAWQQAGARGFTPRELHPLEKEAYQRVIADLSRH
jgi:hypothetical protein